MEKLGSSSLGHLLTLHLGKSRKGRKFQVLPREHMWKFSPSPSGEIFPSLPLPPTHTHYMPNLKSYKNLSLQALEKDGTPSSPGRLFQDFSRIFRGGPAETNSQGGNWEGLSVHFLSPHFLLFSSYTTPSKVTVISISLNPASHFPLVFLKLSIIINHVDHWKHHFPWIPTQHAVLIFFLAL